MYIVSSTKSKGRFSASEYGTFLVVHSSAKQSWSFLPFQHIARKKKRKLISQIATDISVDVAGISQEPIRIH
jgi:hypothetical protein